MKKAVLYVHGKGGSAAEADHYRSLFADCDVIGLDYTCDTPWDCKPEFSGKIKELKEKYNNVLLIANSVGAFFSMNAFSSEDIEAAWFISPIVDMEKLITDMMKYASVTEAELEAKKTIETPFGVALSWEYLCYVRENPLEWDVPTHILYGENDNMTALSTITEFAGKHNASLTVMRGGEHWFHTDGQMKFLDDWIRSTR
ncbi:MAG: alpha/beta hydrolase [Clostridia bacterium]|nr:alpha/beta hydrolase [Clostridia bacterium]